MVPLLSSNFPSLAFSDVGKGKKRLDLAGALLAGLFRQLFRKLTLNVRKYLQLCLDKGSQFVVGTAIKSQVRCSTVWYNAGCDSMIRYEAVQMARKSLADVPFSLLPLHAS